MGAPVTYTASTSAYNPSDGSNPHRWGDFSYTSLDPSDDMTMWTIQEWCQFAGNGFAVQVAELLAPPPALPTNCTPAMVTQGVAGVSVLVKGSTAGGAGFFEPGTNFPNHLSVIVSGLGVTVSGLNSITPSNLTAVVNVASNAAPGLRTITVTNPDGQSATSVTGILTIVSGTALASFSASPTNGPAPLTVFFTNLSSAATNYLWDFGDGKSSTNVNPVNTYTNAGSYTVSLRAIGVGGTNTLTRTNYVVVTNPPPPLANFVASPTNGAAPLTAFFTNLSSAATNYLWDFGDGKSSTNFNPVNTYTNAGSYTVSLRAVGVGGTSTLTRTNYVLATNPPPAVANFVANPTNGAAPLIVFFTNLSSAATNFLWDFGDGKSSTNFNPVNTYTNAGSYTVSLRGVGVGETNTLTRTNYVVATNPPPPVVADFSANPTNGAAPLSVFFTNLSSAASSYSWDFGDGHTSLVPNPANTYSNSGSFTVKLTAVGAAGTNTLTRTNYIVVTNLPPPVIADFVGSPTSGVAPLTVSFTNSSSGASSYVWDFGDGKSSANANPSNTYTNSGSYSVTLTAIGAGGSNTLTLTNYIVATNPPPPPVIANFAAGPTNGISPLTVFFTNLSSGATSYDWDFGDGNSATNTNPSHSYTNAGSYTVGLTAVGASGTNSLTRTNYITVIAPAKLVVSPAGLDFGLMSTGVTAQASLVVSNAGAATLSGSASVSPSSFAIDSGSPFNLVAAASTNVFISFAPTGQGVYSNVVVFTSNGGDSTNALVGRVLNAPLLFSPAFSEPGFTFSIATVAGFIYEVQYKDSLDEPLWQTLQSVPGDGSVVSITNAPPTPAQRFYRLSVQ
jgi:PKD repeat protein